MKLKENNFKNMKSDLSEIDVSLLRECILNPSRPLDVPTVNYVEF